MQSTPTNKGKDDVIPDTPSQSPLQELVDQLFDEGIAYAQQWTFPPPKNFQDEDKQKILSILQSRFSPNVSLMSQLPRTDKDCIHAAFYNITENWFYKALEATGYDPLIVSRSFYRWMNGEINTIVLCGDGLSIAKTMFNHIVECFPMATIDEHINMIDSIARLSNNATIYCLPFVNEVPNSTMLHLMEGNSARCLVGCSPVYVKAMPILIHCCEPEIAQNFVAKNTVIFFMNDHHAKINPCYNARNEMRDFILRASLSACYMNVHCKRDNPMCKTCIPKIE